MAVAPLSLCSSSFTPNLSRNQRKLTTFFVAQPNASKILSSPAHSLSPLTLCSRKHQPLLSLIAKSTSTEAPISSGKPEENVDNSIPDDGELVVAEPAEDVVVSLTDVTEEPDPDSEQLAVVENAEPKREEVFAVVMVGSRQYIVFPGRYLYTQRLKGANVNDKITLNKVLLVGTKTSTYIGRPIVPNATVQAIVEEQTLDKKVIVFKYKRKKNYRRNIGHRQPITRIRITGITGYQDSPAVTLP